MSKKPTHIQRKGQQFSPLVIPEEKNLGSLKVDKFVTASAKVKKVEIELAVSLWWHGSTALIIYLRETIK